VLTAAGRVYACVYGAAIVSSNAWIYGAIYGCQYGLRAGTGYRLFGSLGYDLNGKAYPNLYDFFFGSSSASFDLQVFCYGALMPANPSFAGRNTTRVYDRGRWGIFSENHGRVEDAHFAWLSIATVEKQAVTVRGGGGATAMKVTPETSLTLNCPQMVFEWTELDVPASAQNKSVYIRAGQAWSIYPTAEELWVEAEYIINGTTFTSTTTKSTAVLSDGSTWVQFTIPEFTPAVSGHVRYRCWFGRYEATKTIFVDSMLVTA
jgi:hypothetical protein